jgi:ubiquinone/menaquinone biosynthesis C-methylase UbiE
MDHSDHVNLLRNGIPAPGGVWADFGSGTGAFTMALAELIGPAGEIYSIDQNAGALQKQERALQARFPAHRSSLYHFVVGDFTRRIALPPLHGAIMANALHFQREKDRVIQLVCSYLRPRGRLVLVEYNADRGNPWVPYPLSFESWEKIASRNGFVDTHLLATRPSRFLREIYSAASTKPEATG